MSDKHIDPTQSAFEWFETEVLAQSYKHEGDFAILIHQMVTQFPMTIAQYWETSKAGLALTGKNSHSTWMLSQVWRKLSDWTPSGEALLALVGQAESSGFCQSDKTLREVRTRVGSLIPHVSWDKESFDVWMAHPDTPLPGWTNAAVLALPVEFHVEILRAYLREDEDRNNIKSIDTHAALNMDVLQTILAGRHWPPALLQESIDAHIEGYHTDRPPQTGILLEAWFDTLKWDKSTTVAHIGALYSMISSYDIVNKDWQTLLPRIVAIITGVLINTPGPDGDLTFLEQIEKDTDSLTAAAIYAAIPLKLPDPITLLTIEGEGLLSILCNKCYSIEQRLAWIVEHGALIISEGRLTERLATMESPIRESVALWCILEAQRGDKKHTDWYKSGITAEQAAGKRFLNKHAPNLATTLAAANTLDLSFEVAMEMFLSSHPYRGPQTIEVLPEFS